jgi:hypothetical protein
MLTDRDPVEYQYMSKRLLTDLVKHEEAARSRFQLQPAFSIFGISLGLSRRSADYDNLYELAGRSLQLVSDHTAGLESTWSPYVHATVDLRSGAFEPLQGWRGGHVACFAGEATTDEGASVFVALIGSASNWRGFRADDETLGGFTPSDMLGLYGLVDAVREPDDPEIGLRERMDELDFERGRKLRQAIDFVRKGARPFGPQRLSFLAHRMMSEENYRIDDVTYDRVLVAAPLWIATPAPTPSPRGIPAS